MQVTVIGKQIDVGDALRRHIEEELARVMAKYVADPLEATVVMSRQAHRFRADISAHAGRDVVIQGRGAAADAYAAFDEAAERIAKQLRRYKRRLRDYHARARNDLDTLVAQQYVLASENTTSGDEPADGPPAIIAEMETPIATLTVGEAVMRMDLADAPLVLFRNRAHGGLNVVYRRDDGNVGWIDPSLTGQDAAAPAPSTSAEGRAKQRHSH